MTDPGFTSNVAARVANASTVPCDTCGAVGWELCRPVRHPEQAQHGQGWWTHAERADDAARAAEVGWEPDPGDLPASHDWT